MELCVRCWFVYILKRTMIKVNMVTWSDNILVDYISKRCVYYVVNKM